MRLVGTSLRTSSTYARFSSFNQQNHVYFDWYVAYVPIRLCVYLAQPQWVPTIALSFKYSVEARGPPRVKE
jgi:hypothetical protein